MTQSTMEKTALRPRTVSRSVSRFASQTLMSALIGLIIAFGAVQAFWPFQAVELFGFRTSLISNTGSMDPSLKRSDLIVIVKADFADIQLGDKIAFLSLERLDGQVQSICVVHSVVEELTDARTGRVSYRTQGTNPVTNPEPDWRLVTQDGADGTNQFIGKYAFTVPALGLISAYLRSPYGLASLVVDTLVIMAIWHIIKNSPDEDADQDTDQNTDQDADQDADQNTTQVTT